MARLRCGSGDIEVGVTHNHFIQTNTRENIINQRVSKIFCELGLRGTQLNCGGVAVDS